MSELNALQHEIDTRKTVTISVTLPLDLVTALRDPTASNIRATQHASHLLVQELRALPNQLFDDPAIRIHVYKGNAAQKSSELQLLFHGQMRGSTALGQLIGWILGSGHVVMGKHQLLWCWGEDGGQVDLFDEKSRPSLWVTLNQLGVEDEMLVSLVEKLEAAHILERLEKMLVGDEGAER